MQQEQEYKKVQNLIYAKAHSFARTTGYEVDDFIAQGNLIYCQSLLKYDVNRGKFITLLYLSLNLGLISYTQQLSKQIPKYTEELKEETVEPLSAMQERSYKLMKKISKTTKATKTVVDLILNDPITLFKGEALSKTKKYVAVKRYLHYNLGCSWANTKKSLDELQQLAYCCN